MKIRISILFVALAVFAVPTFAQQESVHLMRPPEDGTIDGGGAYYIGTYMDNPCTAEQDWIEVDYDVNVYQEIWQTSTGQTRLLVDETSYMSGTDQYGSMKYASGWGQSDVASNWQPVTTRYYHKVNTYDQFHVVTVVDVDPGSGQTMVSVETACGDGSPSSKE